MIMNRKLLLFCLIASPIFCQSQKPSNTGANANASLSKTINWPSTKIGPLNPANHLATFSLATSWIPGEQHKGYFRYRISVTSGETPLSESTAYFKLLNSCQFFIVLLDSQDFKLREIELFFDDVVSESGDIVALSSNNMAQMDLDDYRSLVNGGGYNFKWGRRGPCRF